MRLSFGILLLAVAGAPLSAQRIGVDTTIAFQPGGLVAVLTDQGDITIRTGTTNAVTLRRYGGRGQVRLDASSGRISVDASNRGDARVELVVPAGVRVTARSMGGDITIRGTGSDVSVHTQNGDVQVENAAGHVDLTTLSGDITASALKGAIGASTISGDIALSDVNGNVTTSSVSGSVSLHRVTSQAVDANTTSGNLTFDGGIDPAGRYTLATHSGDVSLTIPANTSAQLTVSTWSGSIDSAFPITLQPGEHDIGLGTSKRFTFVIGGGEARIRAESFSGDIEIHRGAGR